LVIGAHGKGAAPQALTYRQLRWIRAAEDFSYCIPSAGAAPPFRPRLGLGVYWSLCGKAHYSIITQALQLFLVVSMIGWNYVRDTEQEMNPE